MIAFPHPARDSVEFSLGMALGVLAGVALAAVLRSGAWWRSPLGRGGARRPALRIFTR